MRHITWDCDGCETTLRLDFVNGHMMYDPMPTRPNMDWQTFGHYLFCPECCVHIYAAIDDIIRKRYEELARRHDETLPHL